MNKRIITLIAALISGFILFCTQTLDPLEIYSNAGIEPVILRDSSFAVNDSVPVEIILRLPHLIDRIDISFSGEDTTVSGRAERDYSDTIRFSRVFYEPDTVPISYTTVLKNGTSQYLSDTLIICGIPAFISVHPSTNLYINEGSSCTLTVEGRGSEPLSYQWYKETEELEGDTNSVIIIDQFDSADAGVYRCEVSNSWGDDMSDASVLVHREVEGKIIHWNFNMYVDSMYEGDTLMMSFDSLLTKPSDSTVSINRLGMEEKCNIAGDSLFVFRAAAGDSGRYVIPVSVLSGTEGDTASLVILVKPKYCIITTQADSGHITLTPQLTQYRYGDSITIQAEPIDGYEFFEWDGDLSGNSPEVRIEIRNDMTVFARFWPESNTTCNTIESGNLNEAIRESSPADQRPLLLCPQPGIYENGKVRVWGKVNIVIQ